MFIDPNSVTEPITYSMYQLDPNTLQMIALPYYMSFDQLKRTLTANPTLNCTQYFEASKKYQAQISLRVLATNSGGNVANYDFDLTIVNHSPVIQKPIQNQISGMSFIGNTEFTIKLEDDTVLDLDNDNLQYSFLKEDGNPLPTWIVVKGLTLSGIPEDAFFYTLNLKLIVSDGFQKVEDSFALDIKSSWSYILKLGSTAASPILALISAIVYANQIYNLCCKRKYSIKKKYHVKPGKQVTTNDIFPITFVKEDNIIIKKIVKKLIKNPILVDEGALRTIISGMLTQPGQNRQQKKKMKLSKIAIEQTRQEHAKSQDPYQELCITRILESIKLQLRANELKRKENKIISNIFKKISPNWDHYITGCSSSNSNYEFQYDEKQFYKYLPEQVSVDSPIVSILDDPLSDHRHSPIQHSPHSASTGNDISILKAALSNIAQNWQTIDSSFIDCKIQSFEKVPTWGLCGKLQRKLKMDLRPLEMKGKELGYGIYMDYRNDRLLFKGIPHEQIHGRTLVVQVTTKKGMILRELIIEGNHDQVGEIPEEVISRLESPDPEKIDDVTGNSTLIDRKDMSQMTLKPEAVNFVLKSLIRRKNYSIKKRDAHENNN